MNLMGLPLALEALSDKKTQEVVAALAIESLRSPATMHGLDPGGGGEQLADFELLDASGDDIGRMEVTTTTSPDLASFASAKAKFDWSFSGLKWLWTIKVRPSASLKSLHRRIESLLAKMETEDPPEDWVPAKPGLIPGDPGALPRDLSDLGVVAVSAGRTSTPGLGAVHPDYGSGWFSLSAASWETQSAVDDEGNQDKLNVPALRYSELFVWLDVGDGQAALGTLTRSPFAETVGDLPLLALSTGMTGVWVASGMAAWPKPIAALLFFD